MDEALKIALPKLDHETSVKVLKKLEEIGVEKTDDMVFVKEEDLQDVLRPIEIRKLLKYWTSTELNSEKIPVPSSPSTSGSSGLLPGQSASPMNICRDNRDPQWPKKIVIPFAKAPILKKPLETGEPLASDIRKVLVRTIVDEVRLKNDHATKRQYETVAEIVVSKYPRSLQDRIENVVIGSGHDSLMKQLISRNENLNRKNHKGLAKQNVVSDTKKSVNIDSYGCVNWSPLVSNDDLDPMNERRSCLKELYATAGDRNWVRIEELMDLSYALLRRDINLGTSVALLLKEWPFLQIENLMLQHARLLIGIDIRDTVSTAYVEKASTLTSFFRDEACGEKEACKKYFPEIKTAGANLFTYLPGVILSVVKCVGEKEDGLFLMVDESATRENIEISNEVNWPRLVVHGDTPTSSKEFTLLVDSKVIIYRMESFMAALCVLFAAYYVFNIAYPKEATSTLEFVQRCLVGLNPDRGCKADKKKKTSGVGPKVLKLINQISTFEWWKPAEQSVA